MENEKELIVIKSNVTKLQNKANEIVVTDNESYTVAADIVAKLKESGSKIKSLKESITKPLNDALKNARSMFAPAEEDCEKAESIIKTKMLNFKREQDRKAREEEEKIAKKLEEEKAKLDAKVEAGEITSEKADEKFAKKLEKTEEKIESIDRVDNTVKGKVGSVSIRKVRKVRIINDSIIPRKYLIVDEVSVRRDALSGIEIPGVEVYEEESLASSRF